MPPKATSVGSQNVHSESDIILVLLRRFLFPFFFFIHYFVVIRVKFIFCIKLLLTTGEHTFRLFIPVNIAFFKISSSNTGSHHSLGITSWTERATGSETWRRAVVHSKMASSDNRRSLYWEARTLENVYLPPLGTC